LVCFVCLSSHTHTHTHTHTHALRVQPTSLSLTFLSKHNNAFSFCIQGNTHSILTPISHRGKKHILLRSKLCLYQKMHSPTSRSKKWDINIMKMTILLHYNLSEITCNFCANILVLFKSFQNDKHKSLMYFTSYYINR